MTTRNNTRRERVAAKRALAAVLALTLVCSLSPAPSLANDESALNFDSGAPAAPAGYGEILVETAAYLSASVPDPGVSSIGGEWAVIGLARNDSLPADYAASYYSNLVRTLRDTGGVLHRVKYTEYSRVVLALSSLGFDPTDVAGYDVLSPLGDFDQVCWQGVNGPIWALIALDSRGYDAPTAPEGK